MNIGMIGLGRMGENMTLRLIRAGHSVWVFDRSAEAVARCVAHGAKPADSSAALCAALPTPRAVWMMVPAAVVDGVIADVSVHLAAGDVLIDGGNSCYVDDIRRAAALAPGKATAPPTPGRAGGGTAEQGYLHCGPAGAGHFVKMVHNGIEYGLMAAYAEGLSILAHANAGLTKRTADAETTPLRNPEHYAYQLDLPQITEVWRRGSVVSSWLLDLTAQAFAADPKLESFSGRVSDSGEGRWTALAAIDEGVPAHVLAAALFERFSSRGEALFADKVCSAMRFGFGGHLEKHS